ncbi:hypothetical protein FB45DRAFT_888846 [Roridomyces roridus]|uniref:F-box domain-containing protein n=1 Tax=Roridomyces roridus TaxID=1738132 RepID=A0AAD7CK24_9AGAR|nr:hypothetical protein FB45DRAFT_888846 [Roridomyces roridus]
MDSLPEELLDRICSFSDRDWQELCTAMHISSRLRRVASSYLLSLLDISQSDVQAGTVKLVLSHAFQLVVFVGHICPIQTLECQNLAEDDIRRLARILGATTLIPNILIYEGLDWRHTHLRRPLALDLLTHLPQTATDTLLIVSDNSTYVSHPRTLPKWSPSGHHSMRARLVHLFWAVIDWGTFGRLIPRARITQTRILQDLHPDHLYFDDWIHIQRLPENHTLVAFKCSAPWGQGPFTIKHLPGITESVYSAFFASLDLQFKSLAVKPESNVMLSDFAAFVARQENLRILTCAPNSFRPSSLVSASPVHPHLASKITHLSAPASYIPHLLPLAPNVERIYVTPVLDHVAYCTALEAIARLPGLPDLALSLTFDLTSTYLPWQIGETIDIDDAPEARLHRVGHLMLCTTGSARYTTSTIRALTPWLGRFPDLQRLSFAENAMEAMETEQLLRTSEAIAAVCPGMSGPRDVVFHITEEESMPA